MSCSKYSKLMFGREMEDEFAKDLSFMLIGKKDTHTFTVLQDLDMKNQKKTQPFLIHW